MAGKPYMKRWRYAAAITIAIAVGGAPALVPAGADAAAWLPAADLDVAATTGVFSVRIATSRDGTTIAAWLRPDAGGNTVRAAIRPPGGHFGPAETLSDPTVSATDPVVAIDRDDVVTVAWIQGSVVRSVRRPAGGTWPTAADPVSQSGAAAPALAAGAAGGAVLAWDRNDGTAHHVESAVRPNGATIFGSPTAVSDAAAGSFCRPQVAMDDAGDVGVLWQRFYDTGVGTPPQRWVEEASTKPAGAPFPTASPGRVALSSTTVGGAGTCTYALSMTPSGSATALWDYADAGGVYRVYSASRVPGAAFATATWGGSAPTSSAGDTNFAPRLALDDAGDAQALWNAASGVLGSLRPALGGFGVPQTLSDASGGDPQIAGSAGGDAMAIWQGQLGGDTAVFAAHRSPDGPFESPALLARGNGAALSVGSSPQVSADAQGNAYVVDVRAAGAAPTQRTPYVVLYDNAPPALGAVSVPSTGTAGQAAAFGATATDRISGASLRWDFGDGAGADGGAVGHAYAAAGRYAVTVTATDGTGQQAVARRTIEVAAAPVSPPGPGIVPIAPPGRATPKLPKVTATATLTVGRASKGRTRIKRLKLAKLAVGETVTLSCSGQGCRKAAHRTIKIKSTKQKTLDLTASVKNMVLSAKATLTIKIARPGYVARVYTYKIVKGKAPTRSARCLTPGAKKTAVC
jgi:PKD repeat protein